MPAVAAVRPPRPPRFLARSHLPLSSVAFHIEGARSPSGSRERSGGSLTTEYGDLESSQTMFSDEREHGVVKLLRANGGCLGAGKR